ncbi:MAG: hypothetical protein NT028_08440 [candidate division Zixibacteria bacterium]|nr:hypothetical protein [candidate division Zixibacteria bacterium]
MKRIVTGLVMAVYVLTMIAGCNQAPSTGNSDLKQTTGNSDHEAQKAWVLEDGSAKQNLLNANLTSPQVAAFADTLARWGYSYRPQNSMVMIATVLDAASSADIPNLQKMYPDSVPKNRLAKPDTVVWQVFENAAFDSSKHTAVITDYRDGKKASIFVEVDVSTDSLNLIRGWVLGDSTMTPPQFNKLWQDYGKCVLVCCSACAVYCLFSGPGWVACWCTCCIGCYPGCMVKLVFDHFFGLFS